MINYWFLAKCFLIGVSAASAVGPIFVLTFNEGALRGLKRGFLTALGAAIGDALLLFLGFMGMLRVLEQSSHYYQIIIDFAGGFLLLIVGLFMLLGNKDYTPDLQLSTDTAILTTIKAFVSTIINPITLFFFIFVSSQLLPANADQIATNEFLLGSLFAGLGSLVILTGVALFASIIGKTINKKYLHLISVITGIIMIGIGGYFLVDAIQMLIEKIKELFSLGNISKNVVKKVLNPFSIFGK